MKRLNEIEARANAATPGPWEWGPQDGWLGTEGGVAVGWKWGTLTQEADGQFIAHARTDVPALVAALRAVLEVHKRKVTMFNFATYDECEDCEYDWPCLTVTAIRQHLGEDA